jgi:hypothetical protein
MAGKKTSAPAAPAHDARRHTVRWHRSRKCLTVNEDTTWRWTEPSAATLMTRAEADAAAARMGGIVCLDGVPIDKVDVAPPPKPTKPKAPPRAAGAQSPIMAKVRARVAASEWREATRLAAKLRLGDDGAVIDRAWQAYTKPDFCRELKRDPETLIAAGVEVLKRRFGGTAP